MCKTMKIRMTTNKASIDIQTIPYILEYGSNIHCMIQFISCLFYLHKLLFNQLRMNAYISFTKFYHTRKMYSKTTTV